ncbi:hypothetical protein [Gulosibacter sp. 10]|uniref:hypothetical protein n=1 Tax=Gulosibacter sp. 10 TaxID=1255570 RepID=UPI00097F41A6|nr:hypothetical protein [Gulosibacter sp. 10]SJM52977.1 hypothetical protein FM112_02750 [Gulosibacter sp. 10]
MSSTSISTTRPEHVEEAPAGSRADRFMRRLLRVRTIEKSVKNEREAHRGFQISMVVSGVRCLITYLLVPILVPVLGFAGVLAAPIGILLCVVAAVNGVISVRRFWTSDHRAKWMYTWFIAVVFVVLAIALATDIARLLGAA